MPRLIISDERLGRSKEQVLNIECLTENLTVRELIRQRVYQEVGDYNHALAASSEKPLPKLLVTPTEMESRLNGKPSKIGPNRENRKRAVKWEDQYELACRGFESNAFFVLIGEHQAENLEESFRVAVDTEITFVKLVPLVGG